MQVHRKVYWREGENTSRTPERLSKSRSGARSVGTCDTEAEPQERGFFPLLRGNQKAA